MRVTLGSATPTDMCRASRHDTNGTATRTGFSENVPLRNVRSSEFTVTMFPCWHFVVK